MARTAPITDLDPRFGSPGAKAVSWALARRRLRDAEVLWLSTVRSDGRPHVVPLIAVWLDGALYFSTGEGEQKVKNLASNPRVTIITGSNELSEGFDLVVEGEARLVTGEAKVRRIAKAYTAKYGKGWRLPGLDAVVTFEVTPSRAFGFGRVHGEIGLPMGEGEHFTQTRWRFDTNAGRLRSTTKA